MLYPKFTQRYLAAIVCCLILVLGISTLFLVYSFYLRRSPLLVESLESMVPSVYNGKIKENLMLSTKFHGQKEVVTESTSMNALKPKKDIARYENGSERNIINQNSNAGQIDQTDIPYWESKKNYSDLEDSNYSDTIYIDDFERNKTNFFTIEKPSFEDRPADVGEDVSSSISYPEFSRGAHTVERIRKTDRMPLRENVIERSFSKKAQIRQHDLNLDALYDRNHDSSESFGITEDDDDVDDLSVYGSGSGDFGLGTYAENDESLEYDLPAITDYSKGWVDYEQMRFDPKKHRETLRAKGKPGKALKNILTSDIESRTNDKKSRNTPRFKGKKGNRLAITTDHSSSSFVLTPKTVAKSPKNAKNAMNEKMRYIKRMKSELAASVRPYRADDVLVSPTKERPKLNRKNKNKKAKIQEVIFTTSPTQKAVTARELNDRKLTKSSIRYSGRDNEISAKNNGPLDEPAVKDPQINPATWVETRTRRVLGNVRKSEERSRQLLLCEEAGGGELCRMLFKGHTSE